MARSIWPPPPPYFLKYVVHVIKRRCHSSIGTYRQLRQAFGGIAKNDIWGGSKKRHLGG